MNSELLQGFRLCGWLVEPLKGRVTGAVGSRHLSPKAVDVLLRLAERPHRLVTREELLERVWGDSHGSQEALAHAVSEIRHAFDDHHDDPWLIQTLPKRGYRLVCSPQPIEREAVSAPEPGSRPSWWQGLLQHGVLQAAAAYLVAGWLLIQVADTTFDKIGLPDWSGSYVTFVVIGGFPLVVIIAWFFEFVEGHVHVDRGRQSGGLLRGLEGNYLAIVIAFGIAAAGVGTYQIFKSLQLDTPIEEVQAVGVLIPVADNTTAVLRFQTFENSEATKAFSDGLSEDIIHGLARIPGLRVSARGDSWALPPNATPDMVRRRLRVASYIEGSVRFLDDKLKVVVQLIDSADGFQHFSRTFETDLKGFGEMQREIARLVVANLKLSIHGTGAISSIPNPDTDSLDAFVLYRMGRDVLYEPTTPASAREAIALFHRALDIDPDYPAAHAGLCDAYVSLYGVEEDKSNIGLAEEACARARSVAPQMPVVLRSIGNFFLLTDHLEEAEIVYESALDVDAQDAEALRGLARVRRLQQRFDEALRLMHRSIELQPGNWRAINSLGAMYYRMGAYADAAAQYRKVVYLDPDNFVTLGNLAATSLMSGDFEIARDALLQAMDIEENPTIVRNLAAAEYYLGNYSTAIEYFRRSIELAPSSIISWIGLADALSIMGDWDEAQTTYKRCVELAEAQLDAGVNRTYALMILAWSTAMSGDAQAAESFVRQAIETDPALTYVHYYATLVYWYVGNRNMAFAAAEKALETGYPPEVLEAEPLLRPLRSDPRYVEIARNYY